MRRTCCSVEEIDAVLDQLKPQHVHVDRLLVPLR